jgi:hypothetical protein
MSQPRSVESQAKQYISTRSAVVLVALLALAHLALGSLAPQGVHSVDGNAMAFSASLGWIVRLGLAAAAALCFVFGPGLVLRGWISPQSFLATTAFVWVPGIFYLFIVGTLAWLLAFAFPPEFVVTLLLVPVPLALLGCAFRFPLGRLVPSDERLVLVLVILLIAIGVGRATWSQGPTGELYGGTISRTLEAELRSDSRISYNAVMLVAHGDAPYGRLGTFYYLPYSFYARGPIAGLAAAPIVLGGGATPPRAYPEQRWEPFDAQGFATYRIVMMLLNATVLLGAYGVLCRFLNRRIAVAGVVLIALSPVVVRETYFTWPKLLAASFALTALVAVLDRRPLTAGLLVGLGYLAHPGGLLALPTLLLIWGVILWRGAPGICTTRRPTIDRRWLSRWMRDAMWITIGCFAIYLSWFLANRGHTTEYFSGYLRSANGQVGVSFGDWVASRLRSLANTLVPLRSYLTSGTTPGVLNSSDPPRSPDILRFSFSYYNTLPFAVGAIYFPLYLYGLGRFARRSFALFAVAILLPFLGFLVYWGATILGMVREGLQFVLVLSLIAAFVGHTIMTRRRRVLTIVRACATARVAEVLFMVLVPTVATSHLFGRGILYTTDCFALALILGGTLALGWISWRVLAPDGPWLSRRRSGDSPEEHERTPAGLQRV